MAQYTQGRGEGRQFKNFSVIKYAQFYFVWVILQLTISIMQPSPLFIYIFIWRPHMHEHVDKKTPSAGSVSG